MKHLQDMALFVEVVKTKSFTQAALNLKMPTPTLSRRLSLFERALGVQLLTRSTRRVEVTAAGATYFAKCAPIVEAALVAHEGLDDALRGTLRIACTHDFATQYLAPLLLEFSKMHPFLNMELDLSSRLIDLIAEGIDAALRIGEQPDSSLMTRKIGILQLGMYAAPSYLQMAGTIETPDDLARQVCVRMSAKKRATNWNLHHATSTRVATVEVNGRFMVGSIAIARDLALAGAGIALIDERVAKPYEESGALQKVLPDWRLASSPLQLVTSSKFIPARVRLLGDFLVDKFKPYSPHPKLLHVGDSVK